MQKTKLALAGLAILLLSSAAPAQSHKYDFWEENYTVQALLGAVKYEDLKFQDSSGNGDVITSEISTLPQLGGAWGTRPAGDRFQYGLECSFLLGFRFDKVNYASVGGSGLYVSISTSMWMFDLAGGPYANLFLDKGRKVRLYGGVGPLMTFADYRSDREETGTGGGTYYSQESVFGLGVYARAGVEFRVHRYGMLGLGARGTWSNVDFTEVGGNSDLAGLAAFVTYTAGL